MSAGPLLTRVLDLAPQLRVEVLDRGTPEGTAEPGMFTERRLSRSPGLAIPADQDWVELDTGGQITRLRKWWAAAPRGGGAWLWYGQLSRFRPSDLDLPGRLAGVPDHRARHWPIEFASLLEGYRSVEALLRPYGCAYGMDPDRYREQECSTFIDRGEPSLFERGVMDALQANGMSPYIGQTALGGRSWDAVPVSPLTVEPVRGLEPLQIRRTFMDLLDRKFAAVSVRPSTGCLVTRVLHEAGRVRGVEALEHDGDGGLRTVRIKSDVVVLACGPLETIRILLMSQLQDRHRMIGRSFTLTQERVAYVLTTMPRSHELAEQRAGTFGHVVVKQFYEPTDPGAPAKCGKLAIYDAYAAELPYPHVRNLRLTGRELASFLDSERNHYAAKISFKGESIPWDGKRISLGRSRNAYGVPVPRIHYAPHAYDHRIQKYAATVIERIAAALGGTRIVWHGVPTGPDLVCAHHHGGAPFGSDRSTAVVAPDGECFDAEGLFVADASVMPTSGATNSSLTTMALSWRLGGLLTQRLGTTTPVTNSIHSGAEPA